MTVGIVLVYCFVVVTVRPYVRLSRHVKRVNKRKSAVGSALHRGVWLL
jgi:hypothetical protein